MNTDLLNLLHGVLGSYEKKTGDNYAFHCPYCHHQKKKLEVHIGNHNWQCWVCSAKGRHLVNLFKKVNASEEQFKRLNRISPSIRRVITEDAVKELHLPREFIPLWRCNSKDFFWNTCMKYLESRGITECDIQKYRLGYCIDGRYKDMIIFPNYNSYGQLNYFTTRAFIKNSKTKFRNPPSSKNIIGFELQINWNLPIVLVESALDAITVRHNAIPLYGKTISKRLHQKIIDCGVKEMYIALDNDAINNAIEHAKAFMNLGISVHLVRLPDGHDPNSIGFDGMNQYFKNSELLQETDLFELQIKSLI